MIGNQHCLEAAHLCVLMKGSRHGRNLPVGDFSRRISNTNGLLGKKQTSQTNKRIRGLHRCWNSEGCPRSCETRTQHPWPLQWGLVALTNTSLASAAVDGEKRGGEQG